MASVAVKSFDDFKELSEVPAHRRLRETPIVEKVRKAVHFDYITVGGLDLDGYRLGRGSSIDTDMPPAFIESYFAESMSAKDPLVFQASERTEPFTEAEAFEISTPPQRLVYLHRSYSIRNRLMIPFSRDGVLYGGVCFSNEQEFTRGEQEFLAFMAEPLYRTITEPLMSRFAAKALHLTAGELKLLELASKGLTSEEIAEASGYRTETVNSYLKSATRKLGAANRTHAIAEAIRRRLMD